MAETTNLSIRIDRDLKNEADQMFTALGMNLTTAITVFVRQAVRQKKIPFEIALNADNEARSVTLSEAIAASERIWRACCQWVCSSWAVCCCMGACSCGRVSSSEQVVPGKRPLWLLY